MRDMTMQDPKPKQLFERPSSHLYIAVSNGLRQDGRGNGEPPGDDALESRVSRLEDDMKEIKGDLKKLLSDVSAIKGKVSSLPSAYEFG